MARPRNKDRKLEKIENQVNERLNSDLVQDQVDEKLMREKI